MLSIPDNHIKTIGILVGGGPAPGINGVIAAVVIEAAHRGIDVLGIQNGYQWLVEGYEAARRRVRPLSLDDVRRIHNQGGSILGTSRTNPAKNAGIVVDALHRLGVDALVSIGGDDTASSAQRIFEHAEKRLRVAHVPKTIDNDLPLPGDAPTFGFETARHFGVAIVENLMVDAQTTSRWYLVVSMGRAAGHLALGIGKAAAATLTIIPEEFRGRPVSLQRLSDILLGAVIKRHALGRPWGVAVLAEGLIEAVDKKELMNLINCHGRYGNFHLDEFGHPRLGEIEFGKLIREQLLQRLEQFPMLKTALIDKDLGYELRCADPIPFDVAYARDLGYGAVKFLQSDEALEHGALVSFVQGRMTPLPLAFVAGEQRPCVRTVAIDGEGYECTRQYMTRLESEDFDDPAKLAHLAAAVDLSPTAFQERFQYLTSRWRNQ